MRILFCNYEYPPLGGGGGVINAMLAEELAKRHDVTVLTSRAFGLAADAVERGVRVVRVPVLARRELSTATFSSMLAYMVMGTICGRKLVARNQYDIINTQFVLPSGPVGDAVARSEGIPNVLTLLGGDVYDPSKVTSPHRHLALRIWVRYLLRRADLVVGDSTDTLDNMRRYYTDDVAAVRIPLAIPRPSADAAARESYDVTPDEVVLVTVGRLIRRKAVDQLISMMEHLRGQKVRLLVIGTGPEEPRLREAIRTSGLRDVVRILGHVDDREKFRVLRMSDIYVSTSQHEGFGLVFLEAMAAGLPVVCYDRGGHADFLSDGETGWLVPLNDLSRFTERCAALIRDRNLRGTVGRANLTRVEDYYIEACAARYETAFAGIVEKRARARSALPALS
jgi:glycosyltransferase involved in cell wall biosynthesis